MKPKTIFYIAVSLLFSLFLISVIYSAVVTKKNIGLGQSLSESQGRNMIHEIHESELMGDVKTLEKQNDSITKKYDADVKIYLIQVQKRDKIIEGYKKKADVVGKLTASQTVEYFNDKVASDAPVKIINTAPDTTYEIPAMDIKSANGIFVQRDELMEIKMNMEQEQANLLIVNNDLHSSLDNRNTEISKLNKVIESKESQSIEMDKQLAISQEQTRKEKRKGTFRTIGVGAAGVLVIVLTAIL